MIAHEHADDCNSFLGVIARERIGGTETSRLISEFADVDGASGNAGHRKGPQVVDENALTKVGGVMSSIRVRLGDELLGVAELAQAEMAASIVRDGDGAVAHGVGERGAKRIVPLAPENSVPQQVLVGLPRSYRLSQEGCAGRPAKQTGDVASGLSARLGVIIEDGRRGLAGGLASAKQGKAHHAVRTWQKRQLGGIEKAEEKLGTLEDDAPVALEFGSLAMQMPLDAGDDVANAVELCDVAIAIHSE